MLYCRGVHCEETTVSSELTSRACIGESIYFSHPYRPDNCFRLLSEGSTSHGGCTNGDTFGPPAHETVQVLA